MKVVPEPREFRDTGFVAAGRLKPLRPPDRTEWDPECLALEDTRRASEADALARELVAAFVADELRHRLRAIGVAVDRAEPWPSMRHSEPAATKVRRWADVWVGLCRGAGCNYRGRRTTFCYRRNIPKWY